MCGRFSLTVSWSEICTRYALPLDISFGWQARYNLAPSQNSVVIVAANGVWVPKTMRWGLIPHWSKDKQIGYRLINARAETLSEKPSFKQSFRSRRCLVPTDGFYEWKKTNEGKEPYRIVLKDEGLFSFAGLWDSWKDLESGEMIESFTIITTEANSVVATLHNRMPAILTPSDEALWLDPRISSPEILSQVIHPYSPEMMTMYRVSSLVNSWKNESPDCIKRFTG